MRSLACDPRPLLSGEGIERAPGRHLPGSPGDPDATSPGEARLTKCCLLEESIETRGDTVVVPWGASFTLVAEGLAAASELAGRLRSGTERDGGTA